MIHCNFNNRIVITGVGLTSPIGNSLLEFRRSLLEGKSGVRPFDVRLMGAVPAGVCEFDETKHQTKKDRKLGTRAGAISVYCANEALIDANLELTKYDKSRIGIYVGITEHGLVTTEEEIFSIKRFDFNPGYVSHRATPKLIANNPAGEIALKLGITGPHYTLGAACAAGNVGLIHGVQMLILNEVDMAIAGGVSESIRTFITFASFKSEKALGHHSDPEKISRPFDVARNGIVISEGGCLFTLEKLENALQRNAKIYGEVVGYGINTDATDYVVPNWERQAECMQMALRRAGLHPGDINIINTHGTSTPLAVSDIQYILNNSFGMLGINSTVIVEKYV